MLYTKVKMNEDCEENGYQENAHIASKRKYFGFDCRAFGLCDLLAIGLRFLRLAFGLCYLLLLSIVSLALLLRRSIIRVRLRGRPITQRNTRRYGLISTKCNISSRFV